jgi:HEAT repeat protein
MKEHAYTLNESLQKLMNTVELSHDESERQQAIHELGHLPGSDPARALIECFKFAMWRETRLHVARSLGRTGHERAVEFLTRQVKYSDDTGIAAECVLALGESGSHAACEFLLDIVRQKDHPLKREAIIGLGRNPTFDCDAVLEKQLAIRAEISPSAFQFLVLALGARRSIKSWPLLRPLFQDQAVMNQPQIFNALIIAAGQLGSREDLPLLRSLNTRFRYFAQQLQRNAILQVESRVNLHVEDMLTLYLAADSGENKVEYLLPLAEFAYADVQKAASQMGSGLSAEEEAGVILKDVTYDDSVQILEILKRPELDGRALWSQGLLARMIRLNASLKPAELLQKGIGKTQLLRLLCGVKWRLGRDWAESLMGNDGEDVATRIDAINAWSWQILMSLPVEGGLALKVSLSIARKMKDGPVKSRLTRAFGQIGETNTDLNAYLKEQVSGTDTARYSAYAALGGLQYEESATLLGRRVQTLATQNFAEAEWISVLRAACEVGAFFSGSTLRGIAAKLPKTGEVWLLRLLGHAQTPDYHDMIARYVTSESFSDAMLGLAAAANQKCDDKLSAILEDRLTSSVASIRSRAEFAICRAGNVAAKQRLFKSFQNADRDQAPRLLHLLRSVEVHSVGSDAEGLAKVLVELSEQKWCQSDSEVVNALTNLSDNLRSEAKQANGRGANTAANLPPDNIKKIDESLQVRLPQVQQLSEVIRSVLRNAELTFLHPELFTENVDKSTVIVEFVKSIDIYLQDRLGNSIFLRGGVDIVGKMQSRVQLLQLDDESVSTAKLLKDLQCTQSFGVDDFPHHKLISMARTIATGKIVRDQYKVIDGLRAWALLLLIFCREFSINGTKIGPILPVKNPNNRNICDLAATLNSLQELRNRAAHRGTMVDQAALGKIRDDSLKVLGLLMATI